MSQNNQIKEFNQKVIEHNDLIMATARMPKTSLVAFEYIVSNIDPDNIPEDYKINISKSRMLEFFQTKPNDRKKKSRIQDDILKLQKDAIFIFEKEEIKEINGKERKVISNTSIAPLSTIQWSNVSDIIHIRLNPDIVPYISDLKRNFTNYPISDIIDFKSRHTIVIYRWLLMNYNQFKNYQNTGKRNTKALESYKNPEVDIELLRKMTDTTDEYSRSNDFVRRVVDKAIDEINEKTKYEVHYDKIRNNRKLVRIQFHMNEPIDLIEPEKQTSKQTGVTDNALTYLDAIKNTYTTMLIEYGLLTEIEMTDEDIMSRLLQNVYPLYDEIEEKRGINGIRAHLNYLQKNIDPTIPVNNRNIVKFLNTSAKQRIAQITIEDIKKVNENKQTKKTTNYKNRNVRIEEIPEYMLHQEEPNNPEGVANARKALNDLLKK